MTAKNRVVSIRLTEADYALLASEAELAKVTVSRFVVAAIDEHIRVRRRWRRMYRLTNVADEFRLLPRGRTVGSSAGMNLEASPQVRPEDY